MRQRRTFLVVLIAGMAGVAIGTDHSLLGLALFIGAFYAAR